MGAVGLCVYVHAIVGWLGVRWGGTAVWCVSRVNSLLVMFGLPVAALWLGICRVVGRASLEIQ